MATIKSFTSLEQSRKLAEILPLESADMCLTFVNNRWNPVWGKADDIYQLQKDCYEPDYTKDEYVDFDEFEPKVIHCWSFAALLQVLPLGICDELDGCDYELEIDMIDKMPRYIRLDDIYHSQFPYDFEKDSLLDNIVESIIWLNDNNYFEL